jgi:hypothetical protein
MKLIYQCLQCGARSERPVPKTTATQMEHVFLAVDKKEIRGWIRHQCAEELFGFAHIVGVINE